MESIIMSVMLELQWKLLGDTTRNKAFFRALQQVIRKGKTTVTDIGSGTGFLSFLASKLGAASCTGYETDAELVALSEQLAQQNKIKNCRFIAQSSLRAKHPEKTDLVVCETLGNFALEENIIENMNDAKRFLKSGGALCPMEVRQFAAPVTSLRLANKVNIWDTIGFDLDFSQMKGEALSYMYVEKITPEDLSGAGMTREWDIVDFSKKESSVRRRKTSWKFPKPQTIHGFCVWWEALLTPGIILSTSPYAAPTHWEQIFLPLPQSINIPANKTLVLEIFSDTRLSVGCDVSWKTSVQ